jgi:hypothetical protein
MDQLGKQAWTVAELLQMLDDLKDRYSGEMRRAVRRREMDMAELSLGGEDACDRMARELKERSNWRWQDQQELFPKRSLRAVPRRT